jgi:hypothetical protein
MGAKLTMRDSAVILDVYKYRYLTATQIEKLHFPSMQMACRRQLRSVPTAGGERQRLWTPERWRLRWGA